MEGGQRGFCLRSGSGVRKNLIPLLEHRKTIDHDIFEKVFSSARDKLTGGKTTALQCLSVVVQEVDDIIDCLGRENKRRRHDVRRRGGW